MDCPGAVDVVVVDFDVVVFEVEAGRCGSARVLVADGYFFSRFVCEGDVKCGRHF